MTESTTRVEVIDRVLAPAEAEVWVRLHTTMPDVEVRGRIVGPRCRYAETVEIAYPLRPLPPHLAQEQSDAPTLRAILPEACFWEPISPFLYHGIVELQRGGQTLDRIEFRHGLRQVRLGEKVLLNGRELTLHCHWCDSLDEGRATHLHHEGFNSILVPVLPETEPIWALADEVGFFVLGEVRTWDTGIETMLRERADHPSCLGWVVTEQTAQFAQEVVGKATHPVGSWEGGADGGKFVPLPH